MLALRETPAPYSTGPRLLDRVRHAIRARHYSRRTEKAYVGWIKRYIFFHGKRHPAEMGAPEVSQFLTSLAVQANVAASPTAQRRSNRARRFARIALIPYTVLMLGVVFYLVNGAAAWVREAA